MLHYALLASVLTICMAGTPVLRPCNNVNYTQALGPIVMTVSDCNGPEHCLLIRNTTHHVTFDFTPSKDLPGLGMQVYGLVMRVKVPYVRNVDLCNTTVAEDGTKCNGPTRGLTAGKKYTSHYDFYIRSRFPEWVVPVEFELTDGEKPGEKLSCSQVSVRIKCNPSQPNCVTEAPALR